MKKSQNISLQNLVQSKFLRIKGSQKLNQLQPNKIISTVSNNQLFFLDFEDQKCVKILQKSEPNDSDEQIHQIGNNYIANLNNLSVGAYKMLHYLYEGKIADQNRKNIDFIVRSRVKRLQNAKLLKQQQIARLKRKKLVNYSLRKDDKLQQNNENMIKFPQNPDQLEQYLQKAHSKNILDKLKKEQKNLQKSISLVGCYKTIKRDISLNIQSNKNKQIQLKFPQINSSRYNPKNF